MKTEWDYTELAAAYLKRPEYAPDVVAAILRRAGVRPGDPVCDVGAGVAHLTIPLAQAGLVVTAVEPNDAMRARGSERTRALPQVSWREGTGETTGQPNEAFRLVTFGSSFNVTDRPRALLETARILRPGGWFACFWNHRDLADPLQDRIEASIGSLVAGYSYGVRREDQTEVIEASRLFGPVERIEGRVEHRQSRADCLEAWRSHATLARQAGDKFSTVIGKIAAILDEAGETITTPYTTRCWMAARRPR